MSEREVFKAKTQDTSVLEIEHWQKRYPWLINGFTTRKGGTSESPFQSFNLGLHVGDEKERVINNRKRLMDMFDSHLSTLVCAEQTHGTNLYYCSSDDQGRGSTEMHTAIPDVDGIYTDQPNLMLASFYADCVPLYFLDPQQRLIGLAHAGWKGTVSGIGPKMVHRWVQEYHSSPERIQVVIGPSIGPCCYEVDEKVIQALNESGYTYSDQTVRAKGQGKYDLDLKQINIDFLHQAGISSKNIEVTFYCTGCSKHLFFSHRKEGGKTGRMASFMCIKEEGTA